MGASPGCRHSARSPTAALLRPRPLRLLRPHRLQPRQRPPRPRRPHQSPRHRHRGPEPRPPRPPLRHPSLLHRHRNRRRHPPHRRRPRGPQQPRLQLPSRLPGSPALRSGDGHHSSRPVPCSSGASVPRRGGASPAGSPFPYRARTSACARDRSRARRVRQDVPFGLASTASETASSSAPGGSRRSQRAIA
jgi:hypothetical protein